MARIYVTEPARTGGVGAMGMKILIDALKRAGHDVRRVHLYEPQSEPLGVPDAWFVSCLYARQWAEIPEMFRRMNLPDRSTDRNDSLPLVAFGGQSMTSPEPISTFADVIAYGDGEATGVEIARLIDLGLSRSRIMETLCNRTGFYVPSMTPLAPVNRLELSEYEPILIDNNSATGAPLLELARGCASKCSFCPIGWAGGTYREAKKEKIEAHLIQLKGKKVNTFAPDFSSVSYVGDVIDMFDRHGCKQASRDARLDATDRVFRKGNEATKNYAFGIEGLSYRIRSAIGKPLTDDAIMNTMEKLNGVFNVRFYMIFGFPGENDDDLDEFFATLDKLKRVYRGWLTISTNHLHSVPHTPLQWIDNHYNESAVNRAKTVSNYCLGSVRQVPKYAWSTTMIQGRELHEFEAFLARTGAECGDFIRKLNGNESAIKNGRWRAVASSMGMDVDKIIGEWASDSVTPWSHVNTHIDKRIVVKSWENYKRKMQLI